MKSIKIILELMPNGTIDIKSSVQDVAMIVLVIEKAKLTMLQRLVLKEESNILVPNGVN